MLPPPAQKLVFEGGLVDVDGNWRIVDKRDHAPFPGFEDIIFGQSDLDLNELKGLKELFTKAVSDILGDEWKISDFR